MIIIVYIFREDNSDYTQEVSKTSSKNEARKDSVDLNSIISASKKSVGKSESNTQEKISKSEVASEEVQPELVAEEKDTSLTKDTASLDTLDYYISILNKSKTMLDIEEATVYL